MDTSTPGQRPNLILGTLAFAVCFSAWGMLAPLAPGLQDDLGLSNTETSVMIAIPVILGSLLRIPLGWLTDRVGGRIVFTVMLAYSAGAALLVGFATSYAALLGAGFLLGTTGASFAVGIPFVAEWYEERRQGFALGVYGVGNIGTAVAAFSVPAIRDAAGQEAAGIVFAVVIGAYALIWSVLARDAPGRHSHRIPYMEVLRSGWDLWRLSLFYFVTFGGFVAMAIFLPKLLTDWFDYSLADAGLRAAGFTVFATAARPVGGWLADRIGARAVLVAVFAGVGLRRDRARLAGVGPDDRPRDDLLADDGDLPRPRQRRRVQGGAGLLPAHHRCCDRDHRRRGRARRFLPTPDHGHRQGQHRRVRPRLRLPGRLRLALRGPRHRRRRASRGRGRGRGGGGDRARSPQPVSGDGS